MVSYRFCRPDDLPLLAEAITTCYNVHYPAEPEMTLERIKREVREVDLWSSSCMVALDGGRPVGIVVGAKREQEQLTWVQKIGVLPAYRGRGLGTHLLQSLSAKLAILGPPWLVAEVPEGRPRLALFMARAGFQEELALRDFHQPRPPAPAPVNEAIQPVSLADLDQFPDLWARGGAAWERDRRTLENREEDLRCTALISPERIEAFVVHRDPVEAERRELWRLGWSGKPRELVFLGILLRHLGGEPRRPLFIPKLDEAELPFAALAPLGFEPGAGWHKCRAHATTGD